MKIDNKSKMIIGACLFMAAISLTVFDLKEKKEPVVIKRSPNAEARMNVNSMTVDQVSDLYCGIVLMPKSKVPAIERFSRHQFAKDIKILPAKIEWDNGCLVAIPEKPVFADDHSGESVAPGKNIPPSNRQPEKIAGTDKKKLHPALFYLFLANASKSEINY